MKRGFQGILPCDIFSSIFEKVDRSKFRKKIFQKSEKKITRCFMAVDQTLGRSTLSDQAVETSKKCIANSERYQVVDNPNNKLPQSNTEIRNANFDRDVGQLCYENQHCEN